MTAFDLPATRSAIAVNKPTADAIDEWLDDDSSPDRVCRKCGGDFHVPYDLDPTPLCNECAHEVASWLPGVMSHWAAALAEVDLLRKPIDDTPPDAPSTASTIDYARKYLAADSEGELTLQAFQASCFATVLVRVAAARSQQAAKIEQLEAEIAVIRERKAKADATDGIAIPSSKRRVLLDLAPATASLLLESVRAAYPWHVVRPGGFPVGRDPDGGPANFDSHTASHIAANSPPVTLALVARIRELENAFDASLDEWNRRDEFDVSAAHRNLMRSLIEKGVVIA